MSTVTKPARHPANAGRNMATQILSPEEVRALLDACSETSATGLRSRALIACMYRGGLKPGEALALAVSDLDLAAGTLEIRSARHRQVALDEAAVRIIEPWYELHEERALGEILFCTLEGGPMAPAYLREFLPRLAAKAGIARRVHANAFRASHAAELLLEGHPLSLVQKQLGLSPAAAARYLATIEVPAADRLATMRQREWDT